MKRLMGIGDVCVCVPIYLTTPNEDDVVSLDQLFNVLGKHPIKFIAPEDLMLDSYFERYPIDEGNIMRFPSHYFEGPESYSELLLTVDFYERFNEFKYILIYQTDAYVFKDDLLKWANMRYDYIGAPWYGAYFPNSLEFRKGLPIWRSNLRIRKILKEPDRIVGNGGFSLRNVKSIIKNLKLYKRHLNKWHCREYEDTFFSIALPNLNPFFKIPSEEVARRFSLELKARDMIEKMGELPFGAHAWKKHDAELYDYYMINKNTIAK